MNLIYFSFPGLSGVRCAFQTRKGGFSKASFAEGNIAFSVPDEPAAVLLNRLRVLREMGVSSLSEVNQVHEDVLLLDAAATPLDRAGVVDADGLASQERGLALMIKTADCQPVLIAHEKGAFVAALHVGWRGNRIGFIGKAIEELCQKYDTSPAELLAVRGPSLGPNKSEFINFDAEWGVGFTDFFNASTKMLNLWDLTDFQLLQAGLEKKNIFSVDICTFEREDLFFSHRRDRGTSGRQGSFIWIEG